MNSIDITPELLTAYALGETSPAEEAAVTAHLLSHPSDRDEVAAIRTSAGLLTQSLASEPSPGLDDQRRSALALLRRPPAILPTAAPAAQSTETPPVSPKRIVHFPHRIVWSSLAAACLVIGMVTLNNSSIVPRTTESTSFSVLDSRRSEDQPMERSPIVALQKMSRERTDFGGSPAPVGAQSPSALVAPAAASMTSEATEKNESPVIRDTAAVHVLAGETAQAESQHAPARNVAARTAKAEPQADESVNLATLQTALTNAEQRTVVASGPPPGITRGTGIAAAESGEASCVVAAAPPIVHTPLLAWHLTSQSATARIACLPGSSEQQPEQQPHNTLEKNTALVSVEALRLEFAAGRWPAPSQIDMRQLLATFTEIPAPPTHSTGPIVYASECPAPWDATHRLLKLTAVGYPSPDQLYAHFAITFTQQSTHAWRILTTHGDTHTLDVLYEIIPEQAEAAAVLTQLTDATMTHLPRVNIQWQLPHGQQTQPFSIHLTGLSHEALFAASVAEFGQVLQRSPGSWSLASALRSALTSATQRSKRLDLVTLIRQAQAAQGATHTPAATTTLPAATEAAEAKSVTSP